MKCPKCGDEGFDVLETCNRCGAPMASSVPTVDLADDVLDGRFQPERAAPGQWAPGRRRSRATPANRLDRGADVVEMLDDDAIEIGEDDLAGALSASPGFVEDDGCSFRIDDELFIDHDSSAPEMPVAASEPAVTDEQNRLWRASGGDLPEPAFALLREEPGSEPGADPIIDRYEDVPERYWAPEIAGLGRRALALVVDQLVVLAVLGIFFLGAYGALQLNGYDSGSLLAAAGLQASALPFALLASVLSLAYCWFFHGSMGRTPGKALVGIEVRTADGGGLSWVRALRRWLGAALGLACAGVGIFWAIFEPRRRGWADLISGTVIARTRPAAPAEGIRR